VKQLIKRILNKYGIQLRRYPDSYLARRLKIIRNNNIDLLFDVGANFGQYALEMRALGFDRRIVSFEPLKDAFGKLNIISSRDEKWEVFNYALGNEDNKSIINVSNNSHSSSILSMKPGLLLTAPDAKYIRQEEIEIRKFDTVFNSFYDGNNVMMKVDAQGYERYVLEGASNSLKLISILQLEMALVQLYHNEMLFLDMIEMLGNYGFVIYSIEDGFYDTTTGQMLQVDVVFANKNLISN
jgi:FkbM family methyltransferase